MTPRYRVYLSTNARAEYEQAIEWWAANRLDAPEALVEDVWDALQRLKQQGPSVGTDPRHRSLPGLRRLHLKRVRYYLYYRVDEATREIEIAAIWHASRGTAPLI